MPFSASRGVQSFLLSGGAAGGEMACTKMMSMHLSMSATTTRMVSGQLGDAVEAEKIVASSVCSEEKRLVCDRNFGNLPLASAKHIRTHGCLKKEHTTVDGVRKSKGASVFRGGGQR
jgi:hypothetical protein